MKESSYLNSINLNTKSSFPYLAMDANGQGSVPEPPGQWVMHWHEDFQFIKVIKDRIWIQTLQETKEIPAGNGVFINRNVVHMVRVSATCHYKSFLFPESLIAFYPGGPGKKFVTGIAENKRIQVFTLDKEIPWCEKALALLDALTDLEQKKPSAYEYEVLVLLSTLWLQLVKHINPETQFAETETTLRMRQFLQYIKEHFSEPVSLELLAQSANVSKTECLRCFKETLRISPYRYLIEYRLSQAMELLTGSERSIGEIANSVGFNQVSHFGKYFKEKTSYSPSAYRKRHRRNK